MIKTLYSPFRKWTETGTLWIYSDPHFSDPDMKELRENYISDEEQIARINSKVGKHDTIIFLGDIGNEETIRKIRGYKVLIMGNHDKGVSNYQRQIVETKFDKSLFTKERVREIANRRHSDWKITIKEGYELINAPFEFWWMEADNGLFDEVYEGPLFIAEKLVLSHEPIDLPYAVNIHGHDHSLWYKNDRHLNVCAEHINYYPVNVNRLLKNGLLSKAESIHRMTIDRATERKKTKRDKFLSIKVGDVLWVYDFMWGIVPCEVDRLYNCRAGSEGGCTFEFGFTEDDIGEYVFFSRGEAEKVWCKEE